MRWIFLDFAGVNFVRLPTSLIDKCIFCRLNRKCQNDMFDKERKVKDEITGSNSEVKADKGSDREQNTLSAKTKDFKNPSIPSGFVVVDSFDEIARLSHTHPIMLFADRAEKGLGEKNSLETFEQGVLPAVESKLALAGIAICWSNVGGIFKMSKLAEYLKGKNVRACGCFLFKGGSLLKYTKLGFFGLSQEYIDSALALASDYVRNPETPYDGSAEIKSDQWQNTVGFIARSISFILVFIAILANSSKFPNPIPAENDPTGGLIHLVIILVIAFFIARVTSIPGAIVIATPFFWIMSLIHKPKKHVEEGETEDGSEPSN